jgi:plastocyanin
MKNNAGTPWVTVLVILCLGVLVSLPGCSGGYGAANPATTTAASASSNSIAIANFAFSPATTTVKAGTAVTWTNKDSTTHAVASDSGVFQSGDLALNGTYTYTFSKAGTYAYHCSIHPSMKGTVIVQ